ncbi:hypothetical protein L4D06_06795 [Enterovibrio makurazakiensis]|uniref:hypothetical protein n=1 Tax=Enterovibrio makurazakiensis TaxID=2910232 RepID=UPI003D21FBA8
MGKNDEPSAPPLWQVLPEQKILLLKGLFGKAARTSEDKAKALLEDIVQNIHGAKDIVQNIHGAKDIEWAI